MNEPFNPDAMPALIANLWPRAGKWNRVVAGVNEDDCAVLQWGKELLVVTADYLNARPIALELGIGGMSDLGRLLVLLNLADLCGTGAEPQAMLVALTMLRSDTQDSFLSVMDGIQVEASKWGIPVIGGDTKVGEARAFLGVALGSARSGDDLFLKNRATPGQDLWSSGPLGSCNAAAVGLMQGQMQSPLRDWSAAAILSPSLPLEKSRAAARMALGSAGTDISDGLGADLWNLTEASGVGAIIDSALIPIQPEVLEIAQQIGVPPWTFAFAGGGDCQFLLTSPGTARDTLTSVGFHRIGVITQERGCRIQLNSGHSATLPRSGHNDSKGLTFVQEILQLIGDIPLASTPDDLDKTD